MTPPLKPAQEWWTADEIADAALPDMPASKRGVNMVADRLGWRESGPTFARRRDGKGGGWEYSWQLFPDRAQRKLLQVEMVNSAAPKAPARQSRDEAWAWYETLPQAVKSKAEDRLKIIQSVETLERLQARGRHLAVIDVARTSGVGPRTVWSWLQMIDGVRDDDRLPYLAPRNRAQPERPRSKECDPEFFDLIKSDYLRAEAPPFSDCYRRALNWASKTGAAIISERSARRQFDATVSMPTQVMYRKGPDALKRMYPPQVRDKTAMHALEGVCGDNHRIDVFVRWPAARGEEPEIVRPQLMVWQDIYSAKILAWRCDLTANATSVLLASGDLIEDWGIPEHVLMDNGREFAAKAVSGGASTRFRFNVNEDDIPGLFVNLGCKIHWATPYSGQSKPIERAFRDFCQSIAKHPRFAGAYTGSKPDAKPENYGDRAIDLEEFLEVVEAGIEEHNNRPARRTEVAWGRSFAEVFAESYAKSPIRKATEAQRRLWLLGAKGVRAETHSGRIKFQENVFWEPWMHEIAGKRVIVRYDPEAFWEGLHIYSSNGAYLGHAPVVEKAGFFNMEESRILARSRAAWKKSVVAEAKAHRKYKAAEVGAIYSDLNPDPAPLIEAKVVKPIFGKGKGLSGARPAPEPACSDEEVRAGQNSAVTYLAAHREPQPAEDTARERFRRALELERRLEAGEPVTIEQQRALSGYQSSPEYISERLAWGQFGEAYFG